MIYLSFGKQERNEKYKLYEYHAVVRIQSNVKLIISFQ